MRNAKLSLLAVFAAALAVGCVTQPPVYGGAWADQVKLESGACPDIDGEYESKGERFTFDMHVRQAVSLAHMLNGGRDSKSHQADDRLGHTTFAPTTDSYQTISLRRTDDRLHVEGKRADGSVKAFEISIRGRCRDSTLLVDADWDGMSFAIVSAVGRDTIALGRAEDGSLLVRDGSKGALFFFWLPIYAGGASDWTLFHLASPRPDQVSSLKSQQGEST